MNIPIQNVMDGIQLSPYAFRYSTSTETGELNDHTARIFDIGRELDQEREGRRVSVIIS